MTRNHRLTGLLLVALALLGAATALIAWPNRMPGVLAAIGAASGPADAAAAIGGPFTLLDATTGKIVTAADFRGRWLLVYFGYTFCPDVCPTDLQKMVRALGLLGEARPEVTPVFITVDPARDRAPVMARYVALFSPDLVGLTGSEAAVDQAVRAYRVYVEKQPVPAGGGYLINHSAFMYLMNPQGKLAAILAPDLTAKGLASRIARAIGQPAGF